MDEWGEKTKKRGLELIVKMRSNINEGEKVPDVEGQKDWGREREHTTDNGDTQAWSSKDGRREADYLMVTTGRQQGQSGAETL